MTIYMLLMFVCGFALGGFIITYCLLKTAQIYDRKMREHWRGE